AWLNKEINHVKKWNDKFYKEFKKLNIATNKSFTNFLLINFDKVKKSSSKIFKLLADAGILVRKTNIYGIKNSLRITIGKNNENKKLILKLKKAIDV
ncbi:aminotransferase class I/II-fold pyridoxal phosphate-dependent enzyme, partial [Pelagibacteraceae bacterium]|nr:aminotransferase class I/II-fold pyridoxal phosphate-dependent enzyme [Pelagibacteraceae bacterium]